MKIRVTFEDGSVQVYEANRTAIGPDGSLQLSSVHRRESPVATAEGKRMVTEDHKLVALIRRDLWRIATIEDYGEAEVIELGREPALALH